MDSNSRVSPSGPKTSKRVRQLYTYGPGSVPANSQAGLAPADPLFFFKGVQPGQSVTVTSNNVAVAGLIFTGTVVTGDPTGSVGVVANNFTAAPVAVPPGGFDLTVEVFY